MNKGGILFPERIDGYSQIPLLRNTDKISTTLNILRSAVIKIEEVIGEKVLSDRSEKLFSSIKDRFLNIENNINIINIKLPIESDIYPKILGICDGKWTDVASKKDADIYGVLISKDRLVFSGVFNIDIPNLEIGSYITIEDYKFEQCKKEDAIGVIIASGCNISTVLMIKD
jgi:hypothetical protein